MKDPNSLVEAGCQAGWLQFVDLPDTPEELAACQKQEAEEVQAKSIRLSNAAVTGDGEGLGDQGDKVANGDDNDDNAESDSPDREQGHNVEQEEDKMQWIMEDGIPIPVFIKKGCGKPIESSQPPIQAPTPTQSFSSTGTSTNVQQNNQT